MKSVVVKLPGNFDQFVEAERVKLVGDDRYGHTFGDCTVMTQKLMDAIMSKLNECIVKE